MKLKNFLQTVVKGENGAERSEPWCQGRGVDVQECPYNSGGENAQSPMTRQNNLYSTYYLQRHEVKSGALVKYSCK